MHVSASKMNIAESAQRMESVLQLAATAQTEQAKKMADLNIELKTSTPAKEEGKGDAIDFVA